MTDISPEDLLKADDIEDLDLESSESPRQEGLWRNEFYSLLSSDYTRMTLEELYEVEKESVDRNYLAEILVARYDGKEIYQLNSSDRHKGITILDQNTLPKLEDHNVVTVSDSREVKRGRNFSVIESFLDQNEIPNKNLLETLKNDRRTMVVQLLARYRSDSVRKEDIVNDITAIENRKKPKNISQKERRKVYSSIQQIHLENLEKMEIIEWNRDSSIIEEGENYGLAREYAGLDFLFV